MNEFHYRKLSQQTISVNKSVLNTNVVEIYSLMAVILINNSYKSIFQIKFAV